MQKDNLYTTNEARQKLWKGIEKVAEAVGATMGTSGSNAIIEAIESPGHLMTNDGYSIANSIRLGDPLEEMGRKILVEGINRSNKASGDGSSTACVLTAAIIREGLNYLKDASPMTIKRSLEECIPLIEESVKAQTRQLVVDGAFDVNVLEQVATISAEDSEIGKRIAEIYSLIGKSGIIHWDVSKTAADSYTVGKGITVEGAGYYSPYMCDATDEGGSTNHIRLKAPHILITKQKVSSAADFNNIAAALNAHEFKELVVFADEVDPLVVPDLLKTRLMRGFRISIIKMPVIYKDHWFEDLAKATGARVVDPAAGLPMKDARIEHLGRVENLYVTKDDTYLDGIKDVSEHVAALELSGLDDDLLRVSRLNTKTARYYVGAHSDTALSYRRLKVEDAIGATYQALNGGIVAGGGSALACIEFPAETSIGGRILTAALKSPAQQIAFNAGHDSMIIGDDYKEGRGFDTKSGSFVNMFEAGIIDPSNIVVTACKNAISIAASVLTVRTVITFPREEEPQMPMPPVISR